MTSLTLVKFLFHIALIGIGCLLIIHEKEVARFERKLAKNIKYFFKGVYVTLKQKRSEGVEKKTSALSENLDNEYDEILSRLSEREARKEVCEDILVA